MRAELAPTFDGEEIGLGLRCAACAALLALRLHRPENIDEAPKI